MTEQKYIGIENELTSFRNLQRVPFNMSSLKRMYSGIKHFVPYCGAKFWSNDGNMYYLDGQEIEIVTPPIALNKGFSSRVTELLVNGRNQVIKHTPHMKHTGYSMHWNLTAPGGYDPNVLKEYKSFYDDIAIPFQLFGLTPMSCGFNIKNKSDNTRFEIAGDSLTNIDQINATALLLGAYTLAKKYTNFPLIVPKIANKYSKINSLTNNMLKNGRYTAIVVQQKSASKRGLETKETQVQNVLELFYDWLSPFVYRLGERDEISNLEAFVTGEKNLEMDDVKYFYILDKKNIFFSGIYHPVLVSTTNGMRSQILKLGDDVQLPLEGRLWQKSMNNKTFGISEESYDWDDLTIHAKINNKKHEASGIYDIYSLMGLISKIDYQGTLDCTDISPKDIQNIIATKLNQRISYNPESDVSAIIYDDIQFMNSLEKNKRYIISKDSTIKKYFNYGKEFLLKYVII